VKRTATRAGTERLEQAYRDHTAVVWPRVPHGRRSDPPMGVRVVRLLTMGADKFFERVAPGRISVPRAQWFGRARRQIRQSCTDRGRRRARSVGWLVAFAPRIGGLCLVGVLGRSALTLLLSGYEDVALRDACLSLGARHAGWLAIYQDAGEPPAPKELRSLRLSTLAIESGLKPELEAAHALVEYSRSERPSPPARRGSCLRNGHAQAGAARESLADE